MPNDPQEPAGPSAAGPSTADGRFTETQSGRNPALRRLPKKRTKTGCLTCRRRRIKCGEEKPICGNCVKSKRICEGYAQRVIFKNPLGISGVFGPPQSQSQQVLQQQHMRVPLYNDYPLPAQQAAAAAQHPMLAPRPIDASTAGWQPFSPYQAIPLEEPQTVNAPQFYYPAPPVNAVPWPTQQPPRDTRGRNSSTTTSASGFQSPAVSSDQSSVQFQPETANLREPADIKWATPPIDNAPSSLASESGELSENNSSQGIHSGAAFHNQPWAGQLPPQFEPSGQFIQTQPQVIYIEDETEDYFDVESDEEMAEQAQTEDFNQLTLIMASANHDDGALRSFTTHLNEPNILATYYPTLGSSPLNNPKTARIFAHFIHSTGPSLSIFERHPTDSSISFGGPVPPTQQGLWTYTLPLKALEHPALLQAILAVSSLHIAFLQGVPTTVSLKHYHYALKRIGRAVGLPLRRKQIGTLAATELLAYYEVISADHSKWNSHVAGAAQLIKEIDFAAITRDLRAHRRRVGEQRRQMGWQMGWSNSMYYPVFGSDGSEDDPFAEKEGSVDEALVGSLLGRVINYDEFGLVDDGYTPSPRRHFSRKDIEEFRIQCDLYWWFTKQDVFHSLVSGDKLFMPYYLQGQCPPRAGIGRIDAIYGSADHLWLLLARVSDFGYRDRRRKLKALRAAGTDWRPGPGLFKFMGRFAGGDANKRPDPPGGSNPPPQGPPQSSARGGPPGHGPPPPHSQDGPPMYGMIPPKGRVRLPSGFVDSRRQQRESPESDDAAGDFTYSDAEHEWEEILKALDTFVLALGREFQPLPPDVITSISTPFGPALQYRTHTIAVIWGFYYAARILLHRLHPSMPPAMMMSAGVAAPTTAEYAQIIGRITAGIYYPQLYNLQAGSLSPTLGSSLTEMTVPVFFAAVQYVDPAQRGWTIAKLRDVARLTGWKTSDAIASGCEKAWIVAAQHGRGPPYERSFESDRDRERHPQDVLSRVQVEGAQESDDRRFVKVQGPDRAFLAMGLLSLEGDMQNLEL